MNNGYLFYKKSDVIDGNNVKHNGNTFYESHWPINGILCSFYMCTVSQLLVCSYEIFVYYTNPTGIYVSETRVYVLK